jgi:small-conductance mechanosensitive channel
MAFALVVTLCILAASVVAGTVGNVSLGNILLGGVLNAYYLGLLVWLAVVVLRNVVTVILRTDTVGNTNIVRNNKASLHLGVMTVLNIGGIVTWLVAALDNFNVLGPTFDGVKSALMSPHKIGSIEIAIGDIVLFIFIVWLSFFISRILRAILRDEVYPRVRLAHGIPMAVSNLLHYAVLLIGFFFAIGAAGIDLNKFTLLAGALGVGIGFGLQNIVSNLVSGIIVLFERPVQTGDKVKIGTNEGEIKRIGLRATVIRTWDGAEVIIPNSRLVLDEVTNWTLSDQSRRIDINVGVAYGSDTDSVIELLLRVAREHDEVLKYPEPTVLFTSFGDSSLNFSLRAWAGRFQDFLRVGSELTARVNKAFAEAGIAIPFPQRDVHMKPGDRVPEPDLTDLKE